MKKIKFATFFLNLLFISGVAFGQTMDNCDKKVLSENCKNKLDVYKYDSQKFSKINFGERAQELEIEVPVFIGEKYRLIFNTASLPNSVAISVYTKNKENKKRVAIYTTKNSPAGTTEFVFDAPHIRNLFIDYSVPVDNSGQKASGCVVFMVGYK